MPDFHQEFLQFALQQQILKFGQFTTKAGRSSPYFFNAGLIHDGANITRLAQFYAQTIIANNINFDMLFGPAYKGIVLAATTSMILAQQGINKPFSYNRKEAKDHGEGGVIVGAPLSGRILIIDDVISAGTSIRESVHFIQTAKATPIGVVIALDRQEQGQQHQSAVQEVQQQYHIPVHAIATLQDLMALLETHDEFAAYRQPIQEYHQRYGIITDTSQT